MNHKKIFSKILFCLVYVTIAIAQSIDKHDDTDVKIIHLTFANEYDSAKALITERINLFPNHPKYYFFMSAMYFQQTLNVANRNEQDDVLDSMQVYGQKAIDLGEDRDEKTPAVKFYLGASYGYLGRYYASEREWFKAYDYGKSGKDYLEEVIEDDPSYYDAYLGLGIFNYYAHKLDGMLKVFSWLLGMSGDEDKGLKYIDIALTKGTLSRLDAKFFLTYIYRDLEFDQPKLKENLAFFRTNFPKNKWAINFEFRIHQRNFDYGKLKELVDSDPDLIFDYHLADYYFNSHEYDKIFQIYNRIKEKSGWRMSSIQNAIGTIYWIRNQKDEFNTFLESLDEDRWVYKNLSSFKGEFSDNDKRFLQFEKQILFADANDDLSALIKQFQKNKKNYREHRVDFLTAVYYFKKADVVKAENYFMASLKNNPDNQSTYRTLAVLYLQYDFPIKNVETFLEFVDDYDSRFINFLGDMIEKKYNI